LAQQESVLQAAAAASLGSNTGRDADNDDDSDGDGWDQQEIQAALRASLSPEFQGAPGKRQGVAESSTAVSSSQDSFFDDEMPLMARMQKRKTNAQETQAAKRTCDGPLLEECSKNKRAFVHKVTITSDEGSPAKHNSKEVVILD
jgi:hypothetical protein